MTLDLEVSFIQQDGACEVHSVLINSRISSLEALLSFRKPITALEVPCHENFVGFTSSLMGPKSPPSI